MLRILSFLSVLFLTNVSLSQENQLGSYDYVLLGEPTHGDGAVFDKKIEIIKQLHRENGFKTILFEAGFYDNFKAWELYKEHKDISIYNESIFSIWTETKAFQNLLEYVNQNSDIKILGVDCQEGDFFQQYFLEDLKSLFKKNKIFFNDNELELIDKTLIYKDLEFLIKNSSEINKLFSLYDKILLAFNKIENKDFKTKILEQTFKSSKAEVEYSLKHLNGEKFPVQNPRDLQMAENFIFLQKELQNEKLILWAANYHIANDLSSFQLTEISTDYLKKHTSQSEKLIGHNEASLTESITQISELKDAIPMGKILKEYYKEKLFSLGFTAYTGKYRDFKHEISIPILTPPENSIETDLYREKKQGIFFLNDYSKEEFYCSSLGYVPFLMNWKKVYDGIYFIPEMYPPEITNVFYKEHVEITPTSENNDSQKIKGTVLNRLDEKPVPYADIYYKSNHKSVVSNQNGEFLISKSSDVSDYLIVSAFGYKNDSIQIKKVTSDFIFKLKPSLEDSFLLDEIVIESKKELSPKEIIRKARANVKQNYIQLPYNQTFYVSTQNYNDLGNLIYNEEAIINTLNKSGINGLNNPHKNIFGEILQYKTKTKNHNVEKWSGIGNLWVQLNKDIILSRSNVLYRTSSYDFKDVSIIDYDEKLVYKINFINNSPGVYSTGYGYPAPENSIGSIYIDIENFSVLRYEHCVVRQVHQNKRMRYPTKMYHKIIETYKEVNGKYFLNFYKQINKVNYLIDNKIAKTSYSNFYLMSENIETENIIEYNRPIMNIKQNLKLKEDENFWKSNNFYIEDKEYKYEDCSF